MEHGRCIEAGSLIEDGVLATANLVPGQGEPGRAGLFSEGTGGDGP